MAETLLQKAQRLGIQPAQQSAQQPAPTSGETLAQKAQRLGIKPASAPAPEPVKSGYEKATDITGIFGGKIIGQALGTKIAQRQFENADMGGLSNEQRAQAAAAFKARTGRDIDFSKEAEKEAILGSQTFKQPTTGQVLGDLTQIGANFIPGGGAVAGKVASKVLPKALVKPVANVATGLATGYASDVGRQLTEQKEKPFTPGLGTVLGGAAGALPVVGAVARAGARKLPGLVKPAPSFEGALGQVLQGKTGDIKKGIKALSAIDSAGVKSSKELIQKFDEKVPELARVVDDELARDTKLYKLNELTRSVKNDVGKVIKTDYVKPALDHLDELYKTTGDKVERSNIKYFIDKAKTQGLTRKEVNDISRIYGQEFGSKAFSKLGDPLTSVNAQKFENVRKGLKEVARQGIGGEEAKLADETLSSIYSTRKLIEKNAEAVNKLRQKIEQRGLFEKLGHFVGKYSDILTGGTIRGVVGGLLPRGAGYKTLNALDLEEKLARNLKIINNALKAGDDKAIEKILSEGKDGAILRIDAIKNKK